MQSVSQVMQVLRQDHGSQHLDRMNKLIAEGQLGRNNILQSLWTAEQRLQDLLQGNCRLQHKVEDLTRSRQVLEEINVSYFPSVRDRSLKTRAQTLDDDTVFQAIMALRVKIVQGSAKVFLVRGFK